MPHRTRQAMLQLVRTYPGVHVRELERRLGFSTGLAAYHLEALERDGAVQRVHEGGYARLFPSLGKPKWSARDMAFLGQMRMGVAFRTVLLLLAEREVPHRQVAQRLGLAKASTSYHLAQLVASGVVTVRASGRQRLYSLADPAYVRGMLANFTPLEEDLEPFERMWADLVG